MSTLPRVSVLVSATLAEPTEIPSIISNFRIRHEQTDDSFITVVKSNKQHISCTFIGPDGCIYAPHSSLKTIEELEELLVLFKKEPLIQRSYSLDVVFSMANILINDLDFSLHFKEIFKYY